MEGQPPDQPPAGGIAPTGAQPPAAPAASSAAAPLEKFSLLDREHRRARDVDQRLSFAMYLVVGFFTLGIYSIYVEFKMIQRQTEHYKRMGRFLQDLFDLIIERAEVTGQTAQVSRDIEELRVLNEEYQRLQRGKERNAALWIILGIFTLGLAHFYVLWFLNDDLVKHQAAEAELVEKSSSVLNKLGVGRHPITVEQVVPDRSFPLYLLLTVVTITLFLIYWAYVRIRDGNEHFEEHDRFEGQLMAVLRAAA